MFEQEYVLCAAIHYLDIENTWGEGYEAKNIERGIVVCGHRHSDCIRIVSNLAGMRSVQRSNDHDEKVAGDMIQGFLTSKKRFLNRKEAANLAFNVGQINEELNELYSENLY